MINIFLGGTCNKSSWRKLLIEKLDLERIAVFNPEVDDWNDEAKRNEIWHRENDDLCIYVITPKMIGFKSLAEIAEDGYKRSEKTILCIFEEANIKFSNFQKIEILLIRTLISNNNIVTLYNLDDLAEYINSFKKAEINILNRI